MIGTGERCPDFTLRNQDGQSRALRDYAGKWLVLYTYPKDDTPGCTIEGKAFSASKGEFDQAGAAVVGLSADDVDSHKSFCNKFSFTIDLLADPDASLLRTLGVPQAEWKGQKYWERTTFLIDPKGVVRKVYPKVNPEGHEREVLADLQRLSASA